MLQIRRRFQDFWISQCPHPTHAPGGDQEYKYGTSVLGLLHLECGGAQHSITLLPIYQLTWCNSLEDMNPPRPRSLLQGSDTMWFGAYQLKYTASYPRKQAISSHHHDNLANHASWHASELIHIMWEGKIIWLGRLQPYQLLSGLLQDRQVGVMIPLSLPIMITNNSDRQGYNIQHPMYWALTHYINQWNVEV